MRKLCKCCCVLQPVCSLCFHVPFTHLLHACSAGTAMQPNAVMYCLVLPCTAHVTIHTPHVVTHPWVTSGTHACMHSAAYAHACSFACDCMPSLHLYWMQAASVLPTCVHSPQVTCWQLTCQPLPPCSVHSGCGGAAMHAGILYCSTAASVLDTCAIPSLGTPCTHACLGSC